MTIDLDAIRARDAAALAAARAGLNLSLADLAQAPADRRTLLAEVDRLTAELHRLQTTSGDVWWAEGEMAENARIRAAVEGLTRWDESSWMGMVAHPTGKYVSRAAVLEAIDGETT